MNFIAPKPTKHMKANRGRRHTELPAQPAAIGQAFSATDDLNKYSMSEEEKKRLKKAEEK